MNSYLDYAKECDPELYQLVYPRAYQYVPNNYTSPKEFAEKLIAYSLQIKDEIGIKALVCFLNAGKDYKLPSFFIDKNFYEAISSTDLKNDIDYETLNLPLPCQIIYFPLDTKDSLRLIDPKTNQQIEVIGITKYLIPDKEQIQYLFLFAGKTTMRLIGKEAKVLNEFLDKEDLSKIFTTSIKILLARIAQPKLVSHGIKLINKGKRATKELWTPNFIGKGYNVKTERHINTIREYVSPRLHWRRGHFRNQHYGIQNLEQKIIWIEPTLVGVIENEETNK